MFFLSFSNYLYSDELYINIDLLDIKENNITVSGNSNLPQWTRLICRLIYNGRVLSTYVSRINNGTYNAPMPGHFILGKYTLEIMFSSALQIDQAVLEAIGGPSGRNIASITSNDTAEIKEQAGSKVVLITRHFSIGTKKDIDNFDKKNKENFNDITEKILIKSAESFIRLKTLYTKHQLILSKKKKSLDKTVWSNENFKETKKIQEIIMLIEKQRTLAIAKHQLEVVEVEINQLIERLSSFGDVYYYKLIGEDIRNALRFYKKYDTHVTIEDLEKEFEFTINKIVRIGKLPSVIEEDVFDVIFQGKSQLKNLSSFKDD